MKLSKETIKILKNFSEINNGLKLLKGENQETINPQKSILVSAKIEEKIPRECCLYQLHPFLRAVSKLKDPEFDFLEDRISISSDETTFHLPTCDESLVVVRPKKEVVLPDEFITTKISSEDMKFLSDSFEIFQKHEFAITGDKSKIRIGICESKTKSGLFSERVIDETDKEFSFIFKVENLLKLMIKDYTVAISAKCLSKFVSEDKSITYFVALEPNSTVQQ